jgi:hypothetical protein
VRIHQLVTLLVFLAWAPLPPRAVAVQAPGESAVAAEILEEDLGEDIEALLAQAEEVFRSTDQPESIPLYERIILQLERLQAEGSLDASGSEWLQLSLFRRAEARFNLLEEEGAAADLRAILRLDPAWEMPAGYSVSRKLSDLLDKVRDAETGVLDAVVEPPDAELYLDGEPLGPVAGPRRVLAGERTLAIRRPGYAAIEQPLAVAAGGSVPIELTLERTSAVLRLATQPSGVEVVLDGEVLAVSEPRADAGEGESSAELALDGLEVGVQLLTLRKPGYRAQELRVEIGELVDYSLPTAALEPSRGTVALSGLPSTARVVLDGAPHPGAGEGWQDLRLELPPGRHELRVEAGAAGLYERSFELADRQMLEIEVRLRPGLMLLGVLGGDRVAATDLERRLAERLGRLERWAVLQRAERGFELLRREGIDRELLRGLAAGTGAAEPPDWGALQGAFDRGLGGSAYLLAVLSDDLYASRADLWLWSAAPGPTRPARRRVSLTDGGGVDELAAELDSPLRLTVPWVGARFVDSSATGGPLVLWVEPAGPAAAAGLTAGDAISAVDGAAVSTAHELVERIAGLAAGGEVVLQVAGGSAERQVTLTLGTSPLVASLSDPSALDPALAARLASLEAGAGSGGTGPGGTGAVAPGWLVRLNRAVILMRSGEWRQAAEELRSIAAPEGPGVGRGTVDYLLGVALLEVDSAAYRDTARGLIGRAAEGGARLEHNDGPLVAPRAMARLETLLE